MSNTTSALPLTYPDLVCTDDLDAFAGETTSDLQSLQQDVYHVLLERPASNPDDLTRGIGIEFYLSGDSSKLAGLPHVIESQLQKDDRIDTVSATITQIAPGGTFSDGTEVGEEGGYELEIDLVPTGSVLPASFSFGYTAGNGLVPLS